jgi:hypothetical protein
MFPDGRRVNPAGLREPRIFTGQRDNGIDLRLNGIAVVVRRVDDLDEMHGPDDLNVLSSFGSSVAPTFTRQHLRFVSG